MKGLWKEVRRILREAHTSLSTGNLWMKMPEYEGSKQDLQCNLHSMVKSGELSIDGKMLCPTCGHNHQLYRLTDKGKAIG